MLGADHHGYVGRLRAIAACAGDDPDDNIEVLIGQLVKILKDGDEVRMSKRAGNIVTLEDLVDAVGVDAARYALARYPVDSPLTSTSTCITPQTNDNPVFYVQYAHARISSVLRNAAELGHRAASSTPSTRRCSTHEREGDLLGALGEFPRVVASAAELREPHRVARYLEELAGVVPPLLRRLPGAAAGRRAGRPTLNRARLWLCEATRQRAGQRPRPARRHRPRADVAVRDAPSRAAARATHASHGSRPARAPAGPERARPAGLVVGRRTRRRRGADRRRASTCATWRASSAPRPTSSTRPTSAPGAAAWREAFAGGDVYYAGKAFLSTRSPAGSPRRASASTSAPAASWRSRCAPASRRRGSPSTATTSRSPSSTARSTPASAGSSSTRSTRSTGSAALADRRGRSRPRVLVRVTVGVEAHTHEFIATAHEDQKFGFSLAGGDAAEAVRRVLDERSLELVGLHSHIGSQIFDTAGFEVAAHRVVGLPREMRDEHGVELPELDLGGGFGIAYIADGRPGRRSLRSPRQLREIVERECAARARRAAASVEPGRAIVGPTTFTALRGRHGQAGRRRRRLSHLRQRRRRHERQHPHRAVRRRLHRARWRRRRSSAAAAC